MSRTITYTYDGIQELTGAVGGPGRSFAYAYDPAGNRTSVSVNGVPQASYTYNAANEVTNPGWTYDAAGNLTGDGTTTYGYDALGRLTGTSATGQARNYAYNGDGTLVSASVNGASASYTQDLAGGLSQILASATGGATSDYFRDGSGSLLAALTGGARTWYGLDRQGSVRQTLDDGANVLATQNYDPYGNPETSGQVGIFGYTGELQDGLTNAEYLRARWYQPGTGTLLGVDPEVDTTGQAYAYAGDDAVNRSDPSGANAVGAGEPGTPPTPAEIAQLLKRVADTFHDIVMPSDATPPGGQSWDFFIGNEVHKAIEQRFLDLNEGSDVYIDTRLDIILLNSALGGRAGLLPPGTSALRPDILDATYKRLFEIKPDDDFAGAQEQRDAYLEALHAAGAQSVHAGPSSAPGTSGVVSAPGGYQDIVASNGAKERIPGGYAVYVSPAPGIILYHKYNGRFSPQAATNTSCSLSQAMSLAAAVEKAILETIAIVVGVGLEGGGGGNPALAY
jgi:RHS repeat-associated protein